MKKYKISFGELIHYQETPVLAKSKEEAIDKFIEMVSRGDVLVTNSSTEYLKVNKL